MADVPPVWLIKEDDGKRTLCDLTGAELDWTAAEALCEERGAEFTIHRPSNEETALREAEEEILGKAGLESIIPLSNDPESKVDLILSEPRGFEVARREVRVKETVKAMREMLAAHKLLPE
ncbi:MAG TPA: hypothetical protein VEP94_01870 [Solirubrobacterales bacterium]|nr:hypothetical protein [Solirubrobacterales bacterium]